MDDVALPAIAELQPAQQVAMDHDNSASPGLYYIPKTWIPFAAQIMTIQFRRILAYHEQQQPVPSVEVLSLLKLPDILNAPKKTAQHKDMLTTLHNILEGECDPQYILHLAQIQKESLALHRVSVNAAPRVKKSKKKSLPIRRIRHYIEKNCPGKALRLVESTVAETELLTYSPETVQQLETLFPPAGPLDMLPVTDVEAELFEVCPTSLELLIQKLPRQSAPGMSGWTYDLLKQLCRSELLHPMSFCNSLAEFLSAMFYGRAGPSSVWARSRVLPLKKKGGGVRPIAIGETFVRLLSGYVVKQVSSQLAAHVLAPLQFGVSVKGGAEVVIHACQLFARVACCSEFSINQGIQQVDFANAFNTVSRRVIYNQLQQHCPQLLPYFRWTYGSATPLFLSSGDAVGVSGTGVRQGDPLGPLLFCLAIQPVLSQVAEEFPQHRLVAYMDDVSVMGPAASIHSVLARIRVLSNLTCNLQVNLQKSILFDPRRPPPDPDPDEDEADDAVPSNSAMPISTLGVRCLGTPVGTLIYERLETHAIVAEFAATLSQLKLLESDLALPILRSCVNTRATYLTRTSPPTVSRDALQAFDDHMDTAILHLCGSSILSLPFPSNHLRGLPLREGGLGIRRMHLVCSEVWSVSFLAAMNVLSSLSSPLVPCFSGYQVNRFRPFQELLSIAQLHCPRALSTVPLNAIAPQDPTSCLRPVAWLQGKVDIPTQAEVCKIRDDEAKVALMADLQEDPFGRAWILSNTDVHVGKVMYPNLMQPALNLKGPRHRALVNVRLLMPVHTPPTEVPSCGFCQQAQHVTEEANGQVDLRFHGLTCNQFQGMRTHRHNAVVAIMVSFLNSLFGSNNVSKEVEFATLDHLHPQFNQKRFDIRLVLPDNAYLLFDVTIVCPSCTKHAIRAADQARRDDWDHVRNAKIARYAPAIRALGLQDDSFVPLIFEATGRIEPKTAAYFKHLLSLPTINTRAAASFPFTMRRIQSSIADWAGNMLVTHQAKRLRLRRQLTTADGSMELLEDQVDLMDEDYDHDNPYTDEQD